VILLLPGIASDSLADDWLTYRHDPSRSGVSSDTLDISRLDVSWTWHSPLAPASAWSGPAKWDAYARLRGLRSMRNYDPAFAVVANDAMAFFGSSADDSVRCLDLDNGELRWTYTTDGPIRIAPCFSYGKVYFGSDDGHAYCLDAMTGKLLWKANPVELAGEDAGASVSSSRWIINNQRAIPFWPIRSGVTVVDGTAYFAASMLPWKESYLCAVDAETGKPEKVGHYARKMSGQTMEGAIAVSPGRLVVPQGRVAPVLFDRLNGKSLGSLEGGGGCFVLVSPAGSVFHGPGNKTGWITSSKPESRETIATYEGGNVLCIDGDQSVLLTDNNLAATNFRQRKLLWKAPSDTPYSLILAKNVAICGGVDRVVAYDRMTGKKVWSASVDGHVHDLAISNGKLLVSTDTGQVTCFSAASGAVSLQPRAKVVKITPQPAGIRRSPTPGILHQWNFHSGLIRDRQLADLAGDSRIALPSGARFEAIGALQALILTDAPGTVTAVKRYQDAGLPTASITAEAWVRIDKPERWGGIVGAIQDNGSYERGWILGYTDDRFSFGVASEKEPVKMTYLAASDAFEPRRWYHVTGTYDGKTMRIYVDGKQCGSSVEQEGPISYPPEAQLNIAGYKDENENYPMQGMLHEVRIYNRALEPGEIEKHAALRKLESPTVAHLPFGPYLQFLDSTSAVVRWETEAGSKSGVTLKVGAQVREFEGEIRDGLHEAKLVGLRRNRQYQYRVFTRNDGGESRTEWYECDTFFNYQRAPRNDMRMEFGEQKRSLAEQLGKVTSARGGLCVLLGLEDGELASQIAIRTGLRVIAFDDRQETVDRVRKQLLERGLYGQYVSIHKVVDVSDLPLTGMVANLVASERQIADPGYTPDWQEAYRLLRPNGGILLARGGDARNDTLLDGLPVKYSRQTIAAIEFRVGERAPLAGSGEWSHLYGKPDNSAFGGESLQGVRRREDLQVQWIGRPGARYQPDRNGRKPSPLSIGGRLYLQGLQRIIALDAYNGSILWSLEIPALGRFNMPRDCSNWCADEKYVYLAVAGECWQLDGQSGALVHRFRVPAGGQAGWEFHWGYLASTEKLLLGSAVKSDAPFRNFWGGANDGWYDAQGGDATGKICSEWLFAYDKETGEIAWSYASGLLVNPTLTASTERVFFVESRNRELLEGTNRRVSDERLFDDQFLVALDRKTGKKLWEYSLATEPGTVVFYLAHSGKHLSLVASSRKQYHVYVFDADEGAANWENHFPWPSDNHGGHMARPAIVGGTLYVRPRAFDITNGTVLDKTVPMGGCGTYAATSGALFFRSGNVTVWDRDSGATTAWNRLRPDCWLSTIPAGGMLLSPEAGGGCSCGSWMETSIGFIPTVLLKK
jgi:outer membrane protein assembly factor BamB